MLLFVCGRAGPGERLDAEPARAALAGVLAVAPFLAPGAVRTWTAPSGRAVVAWAGDGVHAEDDAISLVSGRPIRWTGDETADGREPLDPAGYLRDPREWAPALDGRWAAAAYDESSGSLRLASDALGAHPLHTRATPTGRWYGNVATALHALGATGDEPTRPSAVAPLACLLGGGWSLSGDSWWPEVRRLGRGTVVTDAGEGRASVSELLALDELARLPGAGADPETAARLLVAALGALADWPGRTSIVPVTGGRDSRVVLAAALRAGFDFTTVTGDAPGTGDLEAGRALAAAAGVPHAVMGPVAGGGMYAQPARAGQVLGALAAGTMSLGDASGLPLEPPEGEIALWHSGQGGEIGRGYYGAAPDGATAQELAERLERAFTGRRPGRRPPLSPVGAEAVRAEVRGWVDAVLAAGARPADVPDLFYLLRRMGTWASSAHAVVPGYEPTSALWGRRIVPHLLGPPAGERAREALHRRLVEVLAPELLDVPFADGEGWEGPSRATRAVRLGRRRARQAWGEARRRTRRRRPTPPAPLATDAPAAVDPMTDPLRAVRAAARPDHPVWDLLDRAEAEALLTARPEDLDWMGQAYVWRLGTVLLADDPA